MIERIIEWSARNRAMAAIFFLLLAAAGVWAASTTPVDAIPDLSDNQVIVFTEWMGRSPKVIEDQVTYPIVATLQGLPQVKAVRATSMFGMSFVFVVFNDNVDLYVARNRVQERLGAAQAKLPAGVTATIGPDGTGVGHVYWYTVNGRGHDLGALRSLQDWFIRYKLSSVDGVAEVASIGGFVRQYQIDVDPDLMRSYGLDFDRVIAAVQRSNNEVGGKLLEVSDAEFFVRGQGYITGRSDIESIPLDTRPGGTPILLRDVANVQIGGDIRRGALEKDGKGQAVGGIIVMRHGANAQDVIGRVKQKIAQITPGLPEGVTITSSYDRSPLISESIDTLNRALVEEGIIVALVVMIFMFQARSAVRILLTFPISVLTAMLLMRAMGVTSNIMSLGGIALAIGEVVDASIVIVENAYRNIAEAQRERRTLTRSEMFELSLLSAKQVGRAIFFSAAIMVVSFLPVFMLEGQEGKLFHPLAWTKTFVIGGSAIIAIALTPMLLTVFMGGRFRREENHPVMRFFMRLYRPMLNWVLRWPKTTIAINLVALAVAVPMAGSIGSEFMPSLDEGALLFMPVMLPNASIAEVNRVMAIQDGIIAAYPEVDHVLGKAGRAETATDNAPVSMIETIITLKPRDKWRPGLTKEQIVKDLDAQLKIPGVRNGWTQPIINRINMLSTGVRTELGVKIYGDNLDTLETYAIRAERILDAVRGASDVTAERVQGGTFVDITIDDRAIARYGLDRADVQRLIETAIGGENIGQVIEGRARYPIRVRYARELRDNPEALHDILVPIGVASPIRGSGPGTPMMGTDGMKGGDGMRSSGMAPQPGAGMDASAMLEPGGDRVGSAMPGAGSSALISASSQSYVRLGDVARITLNPGPSMITSENGQLRSVVYLNVLDRDIGSFVSEGEARLDAELNLPVGYTYEWSGQYENKRRADERLMFLVPIVLAVIFLMLYVTMRDWVEASIVMFSVPFALVGGVYLMYALGYNFSVAVWVGFISLYGVAVQTGIVMVVYLHQAFDRRIRAQETINEQDLYDATIEGAVLRLRPKLMTVATTVIGLIPLMWATGTGSDVMKPLMTPMIGGLFTSAINVLLMTPVLFVLAKKRALRRGSLKLSRMAEWM